MRQLPLPEGRNKGAAHGETEERQNGPKEKSRRHRLLPQVPDVDLAQLEKTIADQSFTYAYSWLSTVLSTTGGTGKAQFCSLPGLIGTLEGKVTKGRGVEGMRGPADLKERQIVMGPKSGLIHARACKQKPLIP
ncbi:hypothetical protein [Noviherbaspirillum massiliense]|uniref:hypothetical protein n=1 Tax=Noviherbaspirillum massiliense TaxID=1465823 RepID=UPI0011DE3B8A|nr:hypothetical protein [Noviherbaspirillum massiliense]